MTTEGRNGENAPRGRESAASRATAPLQLQETRRVFGHTLASGLVCLTLAEAAPLGERDVLQPGRPVERALSAQEVHAYQITLSAGQMLLAVVNQRGIDVVVSVFDPAGTKLAEVDSPNGALGPEPVTLEAKLTGAYRLEVRAFEKDSAGRYEARIEGILSTEQYAERLAKGTYDSPRLFRLWQEARAEGRSAVERFWQDVKGKAPLVEPRPGDPDDVWVTFLWRGDADTKYAALIGGPPGPSLEKPLARLEGTDLWYLTARMPRDARFSYSFLTGSPPAYQTWAFETGPARYWPPRPDPLNPAQFLGASMAELPDAPAQPWTQPKEGVPSGALIAETIHSEKLGQDRHLRVYTPPGYDAKGEPYWLLVFFDGETYGERDARVPTPVILDNLIAARQIPPVVAVFVASQGLRDRDLGASAPFAEFLATELAPWVRGRYSVTADPSRVILAGSSLGGLCAAFTAFRHPEVFGNVLSQSGAFWYSPEASADVTYATQREWMIGQYARSPRQPLRFYLEAGRFESWWGTDVLGSNRHMRHVLEAKGYPLVYREYNGGHDYFCWRGGLADGLVALMNQGVRR